MAMVSPLAASVAKAITGRLEKMEWAVVISVFCYVLVVVIRVKVSVIGALTTTDQYGHYPDGKISEDKFPDILTFYYLGYLNSLPHQATLIRRNTLIEHGMYDENMRMNADWKFFMLAVFKYQCRYLHKPVFVG